MLFSEHHGQAHQIERLCFSVWVQRNPPHTFKVTVPQISAPMRVSLFLRAVSRAGTEECVWYVCVCVCVRVCVRACVCVWDLSWHPVPVEHPAPLLEDGIYLHTEWANEYQGLDRSVHTYANHALTFDFCCLLCYNTSAVSEQLKVLKVFATVLTGLMSRSHLTLSSFLQTRQCAW